MSRTLQTLLDFNLVDQKKYASIISRTLANKGIITIDDLLNMQDLDKYYGIGKTKAKTILELQECVKQLQSCDFDMAVNTDDYKESNNLIKYKVNPY